MSYTHDLSRDSIISFFSFNALTLAILWTDWKNSKQPTKVFSHQRKSLYTHLSVWEGCRRVPYLLEPCLPIDDENNDNLLYFKRKGFLLHHKINFIISLHFVWFKMKVPTVNYCLFKKKKREREKCEFKMRVIKITFCDASLAKGTVFKWMIGWFLWGNKKRISIFYIS